MLQDAVPVDARALPVVELVVHVHHHLVTLAHLARMAEQDICKDSVHTIVLMSVILIKTMNHPLERELRIVCINLG